MKMPFILKAVRDIAISAKFLTPLGTKDYSSGMSEKFRLFQISGIILNLMEMENFVYLENHKR